MTRYFAELDANSLVTRVVVCDDPQWLETRLGGIWIETADPYSPNAQEVAYCGPGYGHDPEWGVRFAPQWVQPVAILEPEEGEEPWTWYHVGEVTFHNGHLWVSTINENVWEPGHANWRRTPTTPGVPPIWVEPSGSTDAYNIGEHVMHNDQEYVSDIDANGFEPGSDPNDGWTLVVEEPEPGTLEPWQAWDDHPDSLYQIGDEVSHNGRHWKATVGNNHWEPGEYGWEDLGPLP